MNCSFDSLYYGDDGYIVKCKECDHYQLAYISTMLTLTAQEFQEMQDAVKRQFNEPDINFAQYSKSVVLKTLSGKINLLLTRAELVKLYEIMEEADNEVKAQSLLSLFEK